jgi:hypothetical protein
MRQLLTFLLSILCLLILFSFAQARDENTILAKYQPPQLDISDIARESRVTYRNNVWMNTTNWGNIGAVSRSSPYGGGGPD